MQPGNMSKHNILIDLKATASPNIYLKNKHNGKITDHEKLLPKRKIGCRTWKTIENNSS